VRTSSRRYTDGEDLLVPHPTEERVRGVYLAELYWENMPFTEVVAAAGDSFHSISYVRFGTPVWWWLIAEMNPEIETPEDLSWGMTVRVPLVLP
jgi:hypothetical protein